MNKYFAWYRTWGCLPVLDFVAAWDLAVKKEFLQAARKFESGLVKFPFHKASPDARYALAICYKRLGNLALCKQQLEECIRRDPSSEQAYHTLVSLELNNGAFRNAGRILKKALELFSGDTEGSRENADLLVLSQLQANASKNLVDETLASTKLFVSELSTVPRILYELRFGNLNRARSMLELRFQAADETEDERLLFATFCLEQGKVLFARQLLRELYDQNSKSPEISFRLAQSMVDDIRFEDIYAALDFAMEAIRKSDYRHAQALDLAITLYRQIGEELTAELLEARLNKVKHNSCYEMPAPRKPGDSGTLSA